MKNNIKNFSLFSIANDVIKDKLYESNLEINEVTPAAAEDALTTLRRLGSETSSEAQNVAKDIIKSMNLGGAKGEAINIIKNNRLAPVLNANELLTALKSGAIDAENLARVNKGILKSGNASKAMIQDIATSVVREPNFIVKYGKEYATKGEDAAKNLLRQNGYSQNSIDEFVKLMKQDANYGKDFGKLEKQLGKAKTKAASDAETIKNLQTELKSKKTPEGVSKELTAAPTNSNVNNVTVTVNSGGGVGGVHVTEPLVEPVNPGEPVKPVDVPPTKVEELIDGVKNKKWNWKRILAWGVGLGLGAAALWWILAKLSKTIPADMPDVEPSPKGTWPQCLQNLIDSKQGQVQKLKDGSSVVFVNSDTQTYPKGLYFYSNGRVKDVAANKMGSYKCKAGKIIKEQATGNAVDGPTMDRYVNKAAQDLDRFVGINNLSSLLNILKSLKGKTFEGKDAIQEFLSLYKDSEGGDDFIADVESVGVLTLGSGAVRAKRQILSLAKGQSSTDTGGTDGDNSTATGGSLNDIEFTWDGEKKDDGSTPTPVKTDIYRDCQDTFPIGYGCRKMSKVKEIQSCLGLPEKYQTGNFGPITLSNLEKAGYTVTKESGITEELYNKIKENCKSVPSPTTGSTTEPDLKPAEIAKVDRGTRPNIDVAGSVSAGDLKPLNIKPNISPKGLYDALVANGNIKGDTSETYLEDGTVLPATNRIKYKGPDLNDEQLNMLDDVVGQLGYNRIKQKLNKRYGEKVVWQKS